MILNEQLRELAERAIREQTFPGCSLGYMKDGRREFLQAGCLTYDATAPAVTERTVYDVASVTKSIPTGCLALKLIEEERLGLDDQVIKYLPELVNDMRERILIRHLLTYTVVFDLPRLSEVAKKAPGQVMQTIFRAPLLAPPGEMYSYTNAPALLLGLVIERVYGRPLDVTARELFFEPLGLHDTTFDAARIDPNRVAPTEVDERGEVRGVVHDEAARALAQAGHVAGNAGLFSTSPDLLRFLQMLLAGGELEGWRYFSANTVGLMYQNALAQTGRAAALGWELPREPMVGPEVPSTAFGKTGFTGTFVLTDVPSQTALVILSNRTYPKRPRQHQAIGEFRRRVADLVFT